MLLKIRIDQGEMTVVATPVGRNPLFAFHRIEGEPYYRVTHILTGGKMPGWYSSQKSARAAAEKMTEILRPFREWSRETDYQKLKRITQKWMKENPTDFQRLVTIWESMAVRF